MLLVIILCNEYIILIGIYKIERHMPYLSSFCVKFIKRMDHQKALKISIFECKFVTVILFGTISESFRKIVRIVFELHS